MIKMTDNPGNIIAVIPARSGSKTIKDKNIMSIGGKPLIAHSIEHAKQSKLIERIIVSTDSEYYAEIARSYGAETPFIRPVEISGDESTDLEVFAHLLGFLEKNEGKLPEICTHLRPTCPIRDYRDIDNMIKIIIDNHEIDSVRSISEAPDTPFKMWTASEGGRIHPFAECGIKEAYNMPRQKLPKVYIQNASVDVVRSATVMVKNSMTGDNIYGYIMNSFYDIDTPEQFERSASAVRLNQETFRDKIFCFDIDGVIASLTPGNDYSKAKPLTDNIKLVNSLFALGNRIVLHTARGFVTKIDWDEVTRRQMKDWGVNYHELYFGKPNADYYIDDRMISVFDLKNIMKGV